MRNDIRYMEDEWIVFESTRENGMPTLEVHHYCGGKRINMYGKELEEGEDHSALRKWFRPTKNWDSIPECRACGMEVPEQTVMMVRLRNSRF